MSTQENGQQQSAPEQEVLLNISALSELEDSGIERAEMAQRRVKVRPISSSSPVECLLYLVSGVD